MTSYLLSIIKYIYLIGESTLEPKSVVSVGSPLVRALDCGGIVVSVGSVVGVVTLWRR